MLKEKTFQKLCIILVLSIFSSCKKESEVTSYRISGSVLNSFGEPIANITINAGSKVTSTDQDGNWSINLVEGDQTVTPTDTSYTFSPSEIKVSTTNRNLNFKAAYIANDFDQELINWLIAQQLPNGLL